MLDLKAGDNVIFTFSNPKLDGERITATMRSIQELVGQYGSVAAENCDMLIRAGFPPSIFEVALFDDFNLKPLAIHLPILEKLMKLLKPCGKLIIRTTNSNETLLSNLKLTGFCHITESASNEGNFTEIKAYKPDYEVGSARMLSLNNVKSIADRASQLDLEDPDVHFEDPDDLLSEEDLQRPDPSSLKVCGTTGIRKACKSCVCGLKEELDAEYEAKAKENKDFKPSCGNCYLGDAFRCASCPYLGMPAFKPGEKVKLTEDTMQDDF